MSCMYLHMAHALAGAENHGLCEIALSRQAHHPDICAAVVLQRRHHLLYRQRHPASSGGRGTVGIVSA
jgi:hypothetical protein